LIYISIVFLKLTMYTAGRCCTNPFFTNRQTESQSIWSYGWGSHLYSVSSTSFPNLEAPDHR